MFPSYQLDPERGNHKRVAGLGDEHVRRDRELPKALFCREEGALLRDAASETAEGAVGSDHPVAGHRGRIGVSVERVADGARKRSIAQLLRDPPIGARLPRGNPPDDRVDRFLERRRGPRVEGWSPAGFAGEAAS